MICFGFESPHYDSHYRIPAGKKFYTESQGLLLIRQAALPYVKHLLKDAQLFAECLVRHYPFNVDNVNVTWSAFR